MISPLSRSCLYTACPSSVSWSLTGRGTGAWAKHAAVSTASSGTIRNLGVKKPRGGIIVSFGDDCAARIASFAQQRIERENEVIHGDDRRRFDEHVDRPTRHRLTELNRPGFSPLTFAISANPSCLGQA